MQIPDFPPRFIASGGNILTPFGRVMPLDEARDLVLAWGRGALDAERRGRRRLAVAYARPAAELWEALEGASRWRRAAGWGDVEAGYRL